MVVEYEVDDIEIMEWILSTPMGDKIYTKLNSIAINVVLLVDQEGYEMCAALMKDKEDLFNEWCTLLSSDLSIDEPKIDEVLQLIYDELLTRNKEKMLAS